jgi:hypothetical protein
MAAGVPNKLSACLLISPLISFAAFAQDAPSQPSPRQKARALLDGAAEMLSSAQPAVAVAALLHLAENYQVFDGAKSLEYFEQAFAAAAVLPAGSDDDPRGELQAAIVRQAADLNLDAATRMLNRMVPAGNGAGNGNDPRTPAIEKIVGILLLKDGMEPALALIESAGSTGEYPFHAVGMVMAKLPGDDARRNTVFGSAMAAFANRPNPGFTSLLTQHWRDVPPAMAQSAAGSLVNWILDRTDPGFKDPGFLAQTWSGSRGSVTFRSRQETELFDVMAVLSAVDPKRAAEILQRYPDLRAALVRFPQGTQSLAGRDGSVTSRITGGDQKISPEAEARERVKGMAQSRADAALAAVSQDPRRALGIAKTIPLPEKQAEVLGMIAQGVSAQDPGTARQVLNQCIGILDEMKDPAARAGAWAIVAEAAHRMKDDQGAWEAVHRGMADAAALLKADSDPGSPNTALREYWPSTQNYRRIVSQAGKMFGVDAEPLLAEIADPDLALLARIELAQVLLGREPSGGMIVVSRKKK